MKTALILHGAGNNSKGNWFPWLKNKLEEKSFLVWAPDLPDSDFPDFEKWLAYIKTNKDWHFDSESIIIGHSTGATFILRLLEDLGENVKINKAILVSGPVELGTKQEYFQYKRGMLKKPFNWEKIKNSCKNFYFIHSDNDKYECGVDQGKIMQGHLGGHLILKPGEGHFNLEQGYQYKQFPLLLEIINN